MTQFIVDLAGIFLNGSSILNFLSFFPDENLSEFLHVIKKFVPAFTNLSIYIFVMNSIQYMLLGWMGTIMRRRKMA